MKKIITFLMCMMACILTSCINSNLDDIESYTESKITDVRFEYRWTDNGQLHVKQMSMQKTFDDNANTVECTITVPKASGSFTEDIRSNVSLQNLCGYLTLSTGATAKPIGNAPTLGTMADFSAKEFTYEVTAADGTKTTWSLKIADFKK